MSNKEIQSFKLDDINDIGYATFSRVDMPAGAKVINLSYTAGSLFLHAIVKPKHKLKQRWFAIYHESVSMEDYEKKTFSYVGMVNTVPLLHVFEVHD